MKNLILIAFLFTISEYVNAVCSSPVSRTNFSANSVLSSTKLNTDFNSVYTRINELSGDCITTGSVTSLQIADATITQSDLAPSVYPKIWFKQLTASKKFLTDAGSSGPYPLDVGAISFEGTGSAGNTPPALFYFKTTDFPSVTGKTSVFKIKAEIYTNDVAPNVTFTVALYPVTRPTTSGTATNVLFTVGSIVTNSSAVAATPAVDSSTTFQSSEFTLTENGPYVIAVTMSGGILPASSTVLVNASLEFAYSN